MPAMITMREAVQMAIRNAKLSEEMWKEYFRNESERLSDKDEELCSCECHVKHEASVNIR